MNPRSRCKKCGREVEGTRHQGGGFTGGPGPIPKDTLGWDFECEGDGQHSHPKQEWFVPDTGQ
jgi:hypothetical protein